MVVRLRAGCIATPLAPVARRDVGFHPDDRLDPCLLRLLLELPGRVQIAVVRDRQRGLLELLRLGDQVIDSVGAVEEGVLRVTVEMDEGHTGKNTPRSEWQGGGDRFARFLYWWRKRGVKWLWRGALAFFLALVLFLSFVPIGRYLARAGWEEAKILWR